MCAGVTVAGLLCLCSLLLCSAFCSDATAALNAVAHGPSAATMWHRQLRVSRDEIELTLDGNVSDDTVGLSRQCTLHEFFPEAASESDELKSAGQVEHIVSINSALSLYTDDMSPGITLGERFCRCWPAGSPVNDQAEFIAQRCLQQCHVSYDQLRQIMMLVPAKQATRNISEHHSGPTVPRYFSVGAYIFGSQAGVCSNTNKYVWVTRLLCSVIPSLCYDPCFSTAFLSYNIASCPHVDCHNHSDVPNYLILLSRWEGGELWVSSPRGNIQLEQGGPCGHIYHVNLPHISFNARRPHAVLPWTGDRFLMGAFHIREDWRMPEESCSFLQRQGFQLHHMRPAVTDPYMNA